MLDLKEQFSGIYDRYIEKIYRFIYLKVDSREVAEDIASKVFIKAWKAYCEPGFVVENEGAFLYKIARNSIVDHYREKERQKTVSQDAGAEMVDVGTDIHEKAVLSSDIEGIKKAILRLDKDYQDIIIWHYLDDMPIADVAGILGRPEGTVRVMLHRGLKELRGIVQES